MPFRIKGVLETLADVVALSDKWRPQGFRSYDRHLQQDPNWYTHARQQCVLSLFNVVWMTLFTYTSISFFFKNTTSNTADGFDSHYLIWQSILQLVWNYTQFWPWAWLTASTAVFATQIYNSVWTETQTPRNVVSQHAPWEYIDPIEVLWLVGVAIVRTLQIVLGLVLIVAIMHLVWVFLAQPLLTATTSIEIDIAVEMKHFLEHWTIISVPVITVIGATIIGRTIDLLRARLNHLELAVTLCQIWFAFALLLSPIALGLNIAHRWVVHQLDIGLTTLPATEVAATASVAVGLPAAVALATSYIYRRIQTFGAVQPKGDS